MKFRRMLATIISALMIVSAFAFTAWAQEEEIADAELMATGILKEFSGSVGGLGGGMDKSSTKTKYYDAVNDVVFYRFKINDDAAGGTFHWNWFTFTINMDTDDNTVNAAYRMRTNKAGAVPHLKVYNSELFDSAGAKAGTYNGTAIVGDGNWETAKVAITNSNLKLFKQLHTYLAGTGTHPAGFWFDVAYGTIASDEATAVANVEDATKYASEYEIKFNLNYGESADLDAYPTEIPDRKAEGFTFEGWATKADATEEEVEYTDLTCVAVPTANTTYYAVWGDLIEAENAVYISADGNDANGGRHSEDAVLTLSKAMTLLNTDGLDTLYVVGDVDGTGTPGFSEKKIYIEGYSGDGTEVLSHTGHWKFGGDVEFSNITILDSDNGDGRHLAHGHNITFNDTVKTKDTDEWLGQGYYNSFSNIDNTVVVNGGTWNRFYFGSVTDSRITGKTVYEIGGNAKVNYIYTGHGAGTSTQSTKGTTYININGGTVSIDVGGSQSGFNSSHVGLRYFTLNGGTVTKFNTRTRHTYSTYEGYTVFEINKGAIIPDTIGETSGTTDDSESRIVIFNDGAAVKPVEDEGAVVIIATDGTIHADVTVASDYTATLNGYTYTTDSSNKYININGTNYSLSDFTSVDATLAEETTVLIPANLFAVGENAAVFSETPLYEIKWVDNGEVVKTETVDGGAVPTAPELTKTGYTLSWTPEVSEASADVTYNAVWTANNYTVTYKVDGEAYGDPDTYAYGDAVTMREAPAKTGYTFNGWDKTLTTMPAENVEINGIFTPNNYTVTYKVDGEVYGEVETYAYGAAVTMREAPEKEGYTFSGWDKTLTTMPAENVEINGVFTEAETFPTSATYKTYGAYNELNDTYTVELKFSGAKVNQGSFGFKFPTEYMTFKSVAVNETAGIEFLGNISPIYATGEGYYADTWAITNMANAGNIDATNEEVLIATFTFGMTKDQRAVFETALAGENYKFEEYVVDNADAKYHNGTGYLATLYSTDFDTTKAAIAYASHADEEVAPKVTYTTYGTYDEYKGTYTIDIKVKGAKINLGAFGLAFNADHMTFNPNAENAVVLAEKIANYLGITLHNAADGYAFAFDGSSQTEGYIDATENEVLIATLNLTMTPEQREAFVAAGKTMNIFVPIAGEAVGAETLAKYFDGENYLVSIYVSGLETPRLPATYAEHKDKAIEATVADVKVEATFASKNGETVANIAQIKLDDGAAVALEEAGNEAAKLAYVFKALNIGQKYTVTVEKNGYIAGVAEITVAKGENTIEMTLLAGDIKDSKAAASGNGTIDLSDFVRVIRAFDEDASASFKSTVDIDESGAVNVTDISIIKANYNKTKADNTITVNSQKFTPAA